MPSENIRAIGVCGHCGGQKFQIFIYKDGKDQIVCLGCGEEWTPPSREKRPDVGSSEAVVGTKDEQSDMVSSQGGESKAKYNEYLDIPFNIRSNGNKTWYQDKDGSWKGYIK